MKSPAVKRLMREAIELHEPTEEYCAQPVEDNLFEWHFTVRGPTDSDFEGGVYHGRIILPPEYPMKPPSIILLTPNGRFEVNKKICLSISGHHPESWQPSWSIRTALLAIIGFMPTQGLGAIGSLDYKPEERRALAQKSHDWKCPVCGPISNLLLNPGTKPRKINQEARDLAAQISFKGEIERNIEPLSKKDDVLLFKDNSNENSLEENATSPISLNASMPSSIANGGVASEEHAQIRHRGQQNRITENVETTVTHTTATNNSYNMSTLMVALLLTAIMILIFRRILML